MTEPRRSGIGKALSAGEAADWAYGQARTQATSWVKDEVIASAAEATSIDKINQVVLDAAVDAQFQMMYDLGFWSQETLDIANQGANPGRYDLPPPPEAFIEGTTQFATNSKEYKIWRSDSTYILVLIEDALKDEYKDYLD